MAAERTSCSVSAMSRVACRVCSARFLTSPATTAKPRPAATGPGGLDGRVEREQVGARRDILDEVEHRAGLVGSGVQAGDVGLRCAHITRGLMGRLVGLIRLASQLPNRGIDLLGRRGDAADAGGSGVGLTGHSLRPQRRRIGTQRHRTRSLVHAASGFGDFAQRLSDRDLELAREFVELLAAGSLDLGAAFLTLRSSVTSKRMPSQIRVPSGRHRIVASLRNATMRPSLP